MADLTRIERVNQFRYACSLLPEGVNWSDPITPEIALHIAGAAKPRFPETFCSSCGKALGAGNEGVSHCGDHT